MAAEARAPLAPRPAFARVAAPRPRSSASVPALRLSVLYQAGNWPRLAIAGNVAGVPAPLRPLVTKRREGRGRRRGLVPRSTARGVPAASRPAHGGGSNAPLGQAPPPTAGSACGRAAATPAVGLGARAPCRPSRPSQVLARLRACDYCRPLRLHAIAPTGSYLSAARPSPSGRHLLPPV